MQRIKLTSGNDANECKQRNAINWFLYVNVEK